MRGNRGGYGAILRNESGEAIGACAGGSEAQTVIKLELQGLQAGLKLARSHEARKLEISTDSHGMLLQLTNKKLPAWDLRHVHARIKRELEQLEGYKLYHHYRETNKAADYLARSFPNCAYVEFTPSSFAEDLKKIVYEDKIGKQFKRM